MAFTNFEKAIIQRIDTEIRDRQQSRQDTPQDVVDLETIMYGVEADKKTLIINYLNNVGIPVCNDMIAAYEAAKVEQQALLTEMQDYVT